MPEYPDITVYVEALEKRIIGARLDRVSIASPFLLRTVTPPIGAALEKNVQHLRRIGKRIAIGLEDGFWLVLHLMISGRLHWRAAGTALAGRTAAKAHAQRITLRRGNLATFEFSTGTLTLTEAGSQKRASLHVIQGETGLQMLDPGGLEVLDSSAEQFAARLTSENHTLKRALTDPHLFSGIGNAYSDEILFRAQLSPAALTSRLNPGDIDRLYQATRNALLEWTDTLRQEAGGEFPEGVTAFRKGMAVHGKYGQPCPRCGARVQRIRYVENETNYCARCQTSGKLLADRSLSRLLKQDWPRTLEELELLKMK